MRHPSLPLFRTSQLFSFINYLCRSGNFGLSWNSFTWMPKVETNRVSIIFSSDSYIWYFDVFLVLIQCMSPELALFCPLKGSSYVLANIECWRHNMFYLLNPFGRQKETHTCNSNWKDNKISYYILLYLQKYKNSIE